MHRKKALLCAMAVLLLGGGAAMAETVQVKFYDADDQLIVNELVTVRDPVDRSLLDKLMPNPTGEYSADLIRGQKVLFEVGVHRFETAIPIELQGPHEVHGLPAASPEQAPANDLCADAILVGDPSLTPGTTTGAGYEGTATCGTFHSGGGDVWYSVVGSGREMTATTCAPPGSFAYDTKISVYTDGCATLTCVGGNDDAPGCSFGGSTVTWDSVAGQEYLILLHGFLGATGDFELYVESAPPIGACCSCLNPPFDCTIETIDDCMAQGSQFQGDGVPCIVPAGAAESYVVVTDDPISSTLPPVVSTINVPTSMMISDVDVDIVLEHTYIGDLEIEVTHPSGAPSVKVWDNSCFSTDDIDAIFDDEAGTFGPCPPVGGIVVWPDNALSAFDGLDAIGDWTVTVTDLFGGDDGTFLQWSLHITPGASACAAGDDDDDDSDSSSSSDDPYGAPGSLGQSGDDSLQLDNSQSRLRTGRPGRDRRPVRR